MKKLLFVDNGQDCWNLVSALQDAGFTVIQATESGDSVRHVEVENPCAIIMGQDMPPINELALLPVLRRLTDAPIMVLGSGDKAVQVGALLQGADVYLVPDVGVGELLARLGALLRRYTAPGAHTSQDKPGGVYYSVLVTDLELGPEETVEGYDGRAGMENHFKGGKQGLGLRAQRKRKLVAQEYGRTAG